MNFWKWLQNKLGITDIATDIAQIMDANTADPGEPCEKVRKSSKTYEQIERARSERRHPSRHH